MTRRFFAALPLVWCAGWAFGCLWDSDTLRDEAKRQGALYVFITGQFPDHGREEPRLPRRRHCPVPELTLMEVWVGPVPGTSTNISDKRGPVTESMLTLTSHVQKQAAEAREGLQRR